MNKFFLIDHEDQGETTTSKLLKKASKKLGVQFIKIIPDKFNYLDYPEPQPGDMLYRAATSSHRGSKEIAKYLNRPCISTFYKTPERLFYPTDQHYPVHSYHKLSMPKTIWHLTKDREKLDDYIEYLGGFPVIIKATGGSHGIGVMKVDSKSALYSLADFLISTNKKFIIREFIKTNRSARIIVLGSQAIDSIEYIAPEGDFRSNEGEVPNVKPKKFSPYVEELAIKAVNSYGLEFGGVDIIFDQETQPYITEINFPCFYARCEILTDTNISEQMISYLQNKSQKSHE
jgi:RimK family alpha-L-glutamate ligase